jgi:hypothetical protein
VQYGPLCGVGVTSVTARRAVSTRSIGSRVPPPAPSATHTAPVRAANVSHLGLHSASERRAVLPTDSMTSRESWCRPTSAEQRSKELANAATIADGVREAAPRQTRRSSAMARSRQTAAKMVTLARRPHGLGRRQITPCVPVACATLPARAAGTGAAVAAVSGLRCDEERVFSRVAR